MLNDIHIAELSAINNPSSLTLHTITLWFLMLDSFGIKLSTKVKSIINDALASKGSYRAKA